MKLQALLLLAAALMQASAATTPVGFYTVPLTGTGGGSSSVQTFTAMPLTTAVLYRGKASSLAGTSLTDSAATWTDDAFNGSNGTCYVEVISSGGSTTAAGVGSTYIISDSVAATGTLTLASTLNASLTAPVVYAVRKCWTLASVFGAANSTGLQGGTPTTADQIILWNGSGLDTYYYQTSGIGGTGWRKLGDQVTDAGSTVIYPTTAMQVKRGQSASVSLVVNGTIKTGATTTTVTTGYNFLGNPYAAAMTLGSSGLYTGIASTGLTIGTSADAADQVLLWNGNDYTIYYYNTTAAGWRSSTDASTNAANTRIDAGVGFLVRRVSASSITWTAPQHPASF